ncbi:MAG: EAL domain-containing protein [Epsilonproteobacteria bacterium]|nr:EAL domain-containing protein [Campylobacterota bacterium]
MIKKIRAIDSDVIILVISAHSEIKYLTDSIKYQVQGYLFKPLDKQQFRESLQSAKKKVLERKKQKISVRLLEQYQEIIDYSSIVSKTNPQGIITYVNDAFCNISGYSRDELIGKNHNIIRCPDESKETFKELWKTINEKKKTWQGVIKNQTKYGEVYYVKTTIKPIFNPYGEVEEFIAVRTLITDIIHPKKQLMDFLHKADESMVVLMKIEDFHYLENSLDKDVSENIQKEFAKKLFDFQSQKCKFSKIYLLENGEFVFAKKKDNCVEGIDEFVKKLKLFQQQINAAKMNIEPIDYDLSIVISLSHGQHAFENAKIGLEHLLETKQSFIIANKLLERKQNRTKSKIETFKMVKKAIDSYNIVSYFQPIVDNKTKEIKKYESLVRLIDEDNNILSPYLFLDAIKEVKYYNQVSSIILSNSFQALQNTNVSISINLSMLDIENEQINKKVFKLLKEYKESSHRITFELLEDENVKNSNIVKKFINNVRAYGVQIAIDDFGMGYSNFERIIEYKPDILKIDGSLIKNIEHSEFSQHMVEAIVAFTKKREIKTIAEFVENEKIYNIVRKLGVDCSQGYYFGKPETLPLNT